MPAPGDWYGIYFNGNNDYEGIGEFDYCIVRYGGNLNGADDANVFFNTSDSTDEPTPNGRRINMGAYGGGGEAVPGLVCRADLEGDDNDVDGADLIAFIGTMGTALGDPDCHSEADFNNDGIVSLIDLAVFSEEFGRTDCPACP